ncbi:uncharacterized protein LOC121377116 isoform X2 [Gigantopelta aegis]|nr:uncharacterized protein LOC121377116 isoform X2 [Gigantopelta aegis]XP_041360935.1 uncharacterized protein LOC121377116 isoform X2 [Gigantopelta aegis]
MFRALDYINYDNLRINRNEKSSESQTEPLSMLDLCCKAINTHPMLAELTLKSVPSHLAPTLLRAAVNFRQLPAVSSILSNWPLPYLRLQEVLGDRHIGIFEEELGFDLVIFRGVIFRTKACKLKCLDMRGFNLNATFSKLVVQMWPVLSLKKSQLNPKRLAKVIAKTAGVEATRLTEEVLPRLLNEILGNDMVKHCNVHINIPKGERMVVKIDCLQFSTNNAFFMDYLISNCLRSITPLYIQVSALHIRSELQLGDEIIDSLAPFIVLRGQEVETLEGISLRQLEENVFFIIASDLKKFSRLRALDLQDCNIYLQEGKTRSRTSGRKQIGETLHCFQHLVRLDLGFNYMIGCLGEVLDSLQQPLEYLSLRGCDLNEQDLDCLAHSKHATHLRELNVSKLCQFSMFDMGRIAPTYLLTIMKHFPRLAVLNLSQNQLPDASIPEFCRTVSTVMTQLKMLDISANIILADTQLDLVRACAKVRTMQKLRLTCTTSFTEEARAPLDWPIQCESRKRLLNVFKSLGRSDISVEVIKLSDAIFVDLIDVFG